METKLIKIEDLIRLPEVQIRTKLNRVTVDHYVEQMTDGIKFDAIDAFVMYGVEGEEDKIIVADGFHRIMAYEEREVAKIECNIHECDAGQGIAEAIKFSCERNGRHGLSLTRQDRRNAIVKVLENPILKRLGDRPISKLVGVSPGLVKQTRYELANIDATTDVTAHKRRPKSKIPDAVADPVEEGNDDRVRTFQEWVDQGSIEWADIVKAFESASHIPVLIPKTPHKVIVVRGNKKTDLEAKSVSVKRKDGVQLLVVEVTEAKEVGA